MLEMSYFVVICLVVDTHTHTHTHTQLLGGSPEPESSILSTTPGVARCLVKVKFKCTASLLLLLLIILASP
jgi:hypothetical protein